MSKAESFVRVCPQCGGSDTFYNQLDGFEFYRCRSCGFQNAVFPEMSAAAAKQFVMQKRTV